MKPNSTKLSWHNKMRERASVYSSGRCQKCLEETNIKSGVIHHLSYPERVYKRAVEELIDEDICVWLCKECHNKIHIAKTIEESKHHLKRGGHCEYCHKLVYGGWERGISVGLNICVCKKCYKSIKPRKKLEEAGQISLF